ncbi:MAG: patatin-like phospholipase family protein [Candidatus Omnitrophica bacterium]|nr:patatin-like phospholipase family protein [Candidatus Omnitrophota bacterium]
MRYFWADKQEGDDEKVAILKQVPLFSNLSQRELKDIATPARLIEYKKDQVIYQIGDPPHAFFVIASGRVRIDRPTGPKGEMTTTMLHGGEFFGELSILTGNPHSATVTAKNDCLLLEIGGEDFGRLTKEISALGLYFSRFLIQRLRGVQKGDEYVRESKLIAVYSAAREVGKTVLSINLAAALAREGASQVILVDMGGTKGELGHLLKYPTDKGLVQVGRDRAIHPVGIQEHIIKHDAGFHIVSVVEPEKDGIDPRGIAPFFSSLARQYDYIVIDLPNQFDAAILEALHQADILFLLTGPRRETLRATAEICGKLKATIGTQMDKLRLLLNPMKLSDPLDLPAKEELLGHPISLTLPSTPIVKSYTESTGMPYLVASPRAEYSRVVRRIAREISESMVGLALGSGAALGFAHIGVLKVFEREDIPVDLVAGSSMGALIGALWTAGKTADEIEGLALDMARWRILKLVDFDFPARAILKGNRLLRYLKTQLKKKTFQDTLIPLKVTAVNLYTRQQVVIDEGPLYEAVRASCSIPGLLAPFRKGDMYLTDGGLLEPCPVRTLMRAKVHKIIAVNVLPSPEDMVDHHRKHRDLERVEQERASQLPPMAKFRWRAQQFLKRMVTPSIAEVILNSMQTMEYHLALQACEDADVLIQPIHSGIHVLNFNEAPQLIARGEEETLKKLDEIKQLVKK